MNAVPSNSSYSRATPMKQSLAAKIQEANSVLIAEGKLNAISDYFAPTHVTHLTDQDMPMDHGAIRRILQMYRKAFSDLDVRVDILVESEDSVAWQRTFRGTHTGAFRGFPATGRPVVWRDMVTSRFRDGLIVEEWLVTDLAERLLLARKQQ